MTTISTSSGDVELTGVEEAAFLATLPEMDLPSPDPSKLVMSVSRLDPVDAELSTLSGGFNFGGGFKNGPGVYMLFTLNPITGLIDAWFNAPGGFSLTATALDDYTVLVEALDIDGTPADPAQFSMRIFQP